MLLNTEQANAKHQALEHYDTLKLVGAFVDDQIQAIDAARAAAAQLAVAVDAAVPRIKAGGRLLYFGAGTSGRLAMLDSVELHPTFSWERSRSIASLAGGGEALQEAVEGAEDDTQAGAAAVRTVAATSRDVAILVAASGRTPYVLGALQTARASGALTIGIVNNPGTPIALQADIAIVLDTGPEVISGSTRLKAGTAQKIALNTLSSAIMVRLNKVYGNLMVDLRATNAKLRRRATRITASAAGVGDEAARQMLERTDNQIKTAIVALRCAVDVERARSLLEQADGSVSLAIRGASGAAMSQPD